jgi:hypothetical protein
VDCALLGVIANPPQNALTIVARRTIFFHSHRGLLSTPGAAHARPGGRQRTELAAGSRVGTFCEACQPQGVVMVQPGIRAEASRIR